MELWLSGGERLQIGAGVDASTLRTLLAVLRERSGRLRGVGQAIGGRHIAMPFDDSCEKRHEITAQELAPAGPTFE
ncbi:MAG: hypothetical protein DMG59_19395 [Acidobacteria bacterium]|nr:MAG: hypothetical protein DMG59_19395 [Acidobacteriota bacterium]